MSVDRSSPQAPEQSEWQTRIPSTAALLFLLARLVILLALPLEGLRGYGDLINFYRQAAIPGWPFFHYWTEFPPLFPFLSALLYRLAGGQEHVYTYLLIFVLTLADLGSLLLFWRMADRLHSLPSAVFRLAVYLVVLVVLPYAWWYFDPLPVFFLLAGLWMLSNRHNGRAGLLLGIGAAFKFFPLVGLVLAWVTLPVKRALRATLIAAAVLGLGYAGLYALSPQFTGASLQSQAQKGSWETAWALLDGNYGTGNFGPLSDRLDPEKAAQPVGNPPRISPAITLALFGAAGLWGLIKAGRVQASAGLALTGFAFCLFFLWSPGWSPQWVLFLLPVMLLVFPRQLVLLLPAVLILINLMEWPVILSRGLFSLLPLPVLLRTMVLALAAYQFYQLARRQKDGQPG